jgi:hypothetical protein
MTPLVGDNSTADAIVAQWLCPSLRQRRRNGNEMRLDLVGRSAADRVARVAEPFQNECWRHTMV